MSNNPFCGAVPLNASIDREKVEKSTSYIPGDLYPTMYRDQYNDRTILPRNEGCTPLRRYPNGTLDFDYVMNIVIDLVHKAQSGGYLTEFEKAVLAVILPDKFSELIDQKIARTMANLSLEERMLLALKVERHMNEEMNYNAGRGGSIQNRSVTRG